ncbi:MAG: FAD-dependent oxidoreductase [Acidobacteriota bacterium]|nr:FAD-dependent oxidoreductase [Acidobacteriota bacterium]
MKENEKQIQARRNFLKGSAAMGLASVATAVAASKMAQAAPAPSEPACEPDFLKAPEPIPDSKIAKTITTDVVVIGSALSGLSATRAALEAGAKVAVIEKSNDIVYRSSDVGVINSSIDKKLGLHYEPAEVVNAIQDYYHHRVNGDLWRHWAENSGAALDWWLSLVQYKLVDEKFDIPQDSKEVFVRVPHWPHPKAFNLAKEHYATFTTVHQILPDMGTALRAVYNKCVAMGGDFHFATWARQLVRPNNEGRVEGVIAQDKDGNYIKFVARKGVILCTGDYSNDRKMLEKYCPQVADLYPHSIWFNKDANGVNTNTGDGQKMGMWAGALFERGPHSPVSHCVGGPLGDDSFLLVNARGERFMNEDNDGQQFSNAIERQPKMQAFQIFDAKWPEQLGSQGISHGQISGLNMDAVVGKGEGGWTSITTKAKVERMSKKSDTLEGLAKELGLPAEQFVATIKHYNQLARAGKDTDYYKRADRLFPVEKAPFYGGRTGQALLVVMGGLEVNGRCEVLDPKFNPIPGLWAAGNAMGNRFSSDYAVTAAGVSHGTALTFGRLAGTEAAKS